MVFGALFLIGLIFFIDTLRSMNREDFAIFKNKGFWIIIIILIVLFIIYYFLNTTVRVIEIAPSP